MHLPLVIFCSALHLINTSLVNGKGHTSARHLQMPRVACVSIVVLSLMGYSATSLVTPRVSCIRFPLVKTDVTTSEGLALVCVVLGNALFMP